MIAVVEPVCAGLEHVPINTSMLQVISAAFPGAPLAVSGDAGHLSELANSVGDAVAQATRWRSSRIPPRRAEFGGRLAVELSLIASAARGAEGATPRLLVLLSGTASTIVAVKLLRAAGRLRVPVQFVLHGAAADLSGWRSRNPLRRVTDLRSAVAMPPRRRIQYVVLEEAILERITHEHPRLGRDFVGLATRQKGFDVFLQLAERLTRRHPGRVEFHAIGSRPISEAAVETPFLATAPSATKLSRAEYLDLARRLHYVCLPYQGSHYELTASGVLLDAIANALPVIASRTPTVDRLFEGAEPGHCSRDTDDMERAIEEGIVGLTQERYAREVADMAGWQRSRLPATLAHPYLAATRALLARGPAVAQ